MGNSSKIEAPSYQVHSFAGGCLLQIYQNFVKSNWIRSYRNLNDYIKLTDAKAYYEHAQYAIKRVLLSADCVIRVAVLSDDFDVALGFSATHDNVLDYVYVARPYRGIGIASQLVPIKIESFTCITKHGLKIWPVKFPEAKFNPFQ